MLLQLRIHEIYVHIIAKENFEIPRCQAIAMEALHRYVAELYTLQSVQ